MTAPRDEAEAGSSATRLFVVADDHPLFRGALREILKSRGEESVIVEAADFEETAMALRANPEADLALVDLAMPGMRGLSGLAQLRAENPSVPVAVVSASEDPQIVARMLEFGVSGFIPKSAGFEEMRAAIERLLCGEIFVPERSESWAGDPEAAEFVERLGTLTPQQARVLGLVARGLLNKQIAFELQLSEATVKAHVSAVLTKLGVDSRTQAVVRLSQLGIDAETIRGA